MLTLIWHQAHLFPKIQYSCFSACYLSLSPRTCVKEIRTGTISLKINENVRIFQNSTLSSSRPPLVLLFGWLLAKPKHLKKYVDMYVNQGFDVVSVQFFLKQYLIPQYRRSLVRDVADIFEHDERKHQPMLVHVLCSGSHVYGLFLANLEKHPYKYGEISRHLCGQISDSIAHFDGMTVALSRIVTNREYISHLIESILTWVFTRFPSAVSDFKKASDIYQINRLQLPSLFLFSTHDQICSPKYFEEIAAEWRRAGVYVAFNTWDDTKHIDIYKKHKDEYEKIILDFIRITGVKDKEP